MSEAEIEIREHARSGFARVLELEHAASGLHAIIALHELSRGPAFGGIRRRAYAKVEAARAEVEGLAWAMTHKCALAGLDAGGGKTVILDRPGLDPEAAYAKLGEFIEGLGGEYVCGPDVGTSDAQLAVLRRHTRFVNAEGNDAGQSTARGVLAGARATVRRLRGREGFDGLRIGIEGLGAVGGALASALVEAGAQVFGWDPNAGARTRAEALGVKIVDAARLEAAKDFELLMPCALGGSLTSSRVESLGAAAICGSANNQLAEAELDARLAARGILWAPDIVVSAGAVIEGVFTHLAQLRGESLAPAREGARAHIEGIETTCDEVFARAEAQGIGTQAAALELAAARLGKRGGPR